MGTWRRETLLAAGATLLALALAGPAAATPAYDLGGRCVAINSLDGGPFYVKATGLGNYMLTGMSGQLVNDTLGRSADAGPATEWAISRNGGKYDIRSTANGRQLGSDSLDAATGCTPFPEAEVDTTGTPRKGTNRDGTVFGFVDAHLHVTANMRAGGRVISGEPFDRFGIPAALGNDAADHGSDGSQDVTGNLLRTGLPFGTHDTHGWPTFAGWPTHDTNTHQQTYYVWLQRAFEAGLRLVVAQTVDDQPICEIVPNKNPGGCDETRSIKRQITTLKTLQTYVDAQSGGIGKGWFRLVYSPAQARKVIESGKLAVIIGIESSDLFGCSLKGTKAQCSRRDVDRGIRTYRRLGVRGVFVAHWVNNAFSGAALEGDTKGAFINVFNRFQTGSYLKTGKCPGKGQGEEVRTLSKGELSVLAQFYPATQQLAAQGMPTYPPGKQCNTAGLTPLGRYAIAQLMANHMLIEVDHMSERARDTLLAIADRAHYPLISSHNGTGGEWTTAELRKLFKAGGFAAVTPGTAPELSKKILAMARLERAGVGLGTDTGGFASLPGPRPDAAQKPLRYPFKSYDGRVTFTRERTGQRTFDLNTDGVGQYGLLADLIADMHGSKALPPLFRSAEAYLRTWQRAVDR
jgi:microsomal dipeptidase-like Zn-dependent dipeptidase